MTKYVLINDTEVIEFEVDKEMTLNKWISKFMVDYSTDNIKVLSPDRAVKLKGQQSFDI